MRAGADAGAGSAMNCSPFDLNDYFWNDLAESERRDVEIHVRSCRQCGTEIQRLKATQAALLTMADEEIPQRIGFVSDRVYEPSRARRMWAAFRGSAAQLGFASAAMLSAALIVFALLRPVPVTQVISERNVAPVDYSRQIQDAVGRAVADTEAREASRTNALLEAAEKRHDMEHKALMLAVQENLTLMQKRLNFMTVASNDLRMVR